MPIQRCQCPSGPTGYRWGESGTCYCGPGARAKAERQAAAIRARGYRADADDVWRIREKQAPSPAALSAVLSRWIVGSMRPVYARMVAVVEEWERRQVRADADVDAAGAMVLQSALRSVVARAADEPELPFPERQVYATSEAAYRQAMRAERRMLVRLGANRGSLAARLGVDEGGLLGVDIAPSAEDRAALRAWAAGVEGESGIGLMRSEYSKRIERLDERIAAWVRDGTSTRAIVSEIHASLGTDRRHAELVARDQIAKLNGAITKSTQGAAGIVEYTWRSSSDGRTRKAHAQANGNPYAWNNPQVEGVDGRMVHPGEDIQCRCTAIPVIPDDLL